MPVTKLASTIFSSVIKPGSHLMDVWIRRITDCGWQKICVPMFIRVYTQKNSVCHAIFKNRKQIVGPIFFKKTINGDIYSSIISQFNVLLQPDECYCTFKQDGATKPHIFAVTEFQKLFFDDRLISTGCLWPPRSPDLTLSTFHFSYPSRST